MVPSFSASSIKPLILDLFIPSISDAEHVVGRKTLSFLVMLWYIRPGSILLFVVWKNFSESMVIFVILKILKLIKIACT